MKFKISTTNNKRSMGYDFWEAEIIYVSDKGDLMNFNCTEFSKISRNDAIKKAKLRITKFIKELGELK